MKSRVWIAAMIIAAIVVGTVGFSTASDKPVRSCCEYMTVADCQSMRGLTPAQRLQLQNDLQKKIEPAGPESYPLGLKYRTN